MSKRWRGDTSHASSEFMRATAKRPRSAPCFRNNYRPRHSLRLQEKSPKINQARTHLPSPSTTSPEANPRKRKIIHEEDWEVPTYHKIKRRRETSRVSTHWNPREVPEWISYWVLNDAQLPHSDSIEAIEMASGNSSKRSRSDSTTATERRARLNEHDVFMDADRPMSAASRNLCNTLLLGNQPPAGFPVYRAESRREVLRDAMTAPEAIIQRDVLPIVVPSVVNLNRNGTIKLEHFGDEINAEWTKAMTMGGKHPKPDYVAALRRTAFDNDTWDKLQNYANPENPVRLSAESCFPLVIAEAKRGTIGLQEAEFQSTQAAAMAVKQQIHLLWAAYGKSHPLVEELYGQVLVFTVCHNHDEVIISAHYALLKENTQDKLEFHRSKIAFLSLTMNEGRDENKPNTFIENVYKTCGPVHLERIQQAAKRLPDPAKSTGMSFNASELGLGDDDSPSSEDNIFKKPSLPPSARAAQEFAELRALMEEQRADFKSQIEVQRIQLEQQKKESKEKKEALRTQMEQQKKEMEQQRKESKEEKELLRKQIEKLMELLSKKA